MDALQEINQILSYAYCHLKQFLDQTTALQGKMKMYSLFDVTICCIQRYTAIEIKPELRKNILKFGYGINYKSEGMLAHSFDRFYVVTKFILPTVQDLKFPTLKFDDKCEYLQEHKGQHSVERLHFRSQSIL